MSTIQKGVAASATATILPHHVRQHPAVATEEKEKEQERGKQKKLHGQGQRLTFPLSCCRCFEEEHKEDATNAAQWWPLSPLAPYAWRPVAAKGPWG